MADRWQGFAAGMAVCALLGIGGPAQAAQTRPDAAKVVSASTTVRGDLKGREQLDYVIRVGPGQQLRVRLKATHRLTQFMVLAPGGEAPLFVGEAHGAQFAQRLDRGGDYRVRLMLVRSALRRNEESNFVLDIELPDAPVVQATQASAADGAFASTVALAGVSFYVTSPNAAHANSVTVTPAGLDGGNLPVSLAVDGRVSHVMVADINGDQLPEVYIALSATPPDARGGLVAYGVSKHKSLVPIVLPGLDDSSARGYLGHDRFSPVDGMLVRTFPVFGKGGNPAVPTGSTRQMQYALEMGETRWQFRPDKVFDY